MKEKISFILLHFSLGIGKEKHFPGAPNSFPGLFMTNNGPCNLLIQSPFMGSGIPMASKDLT
jgi:hypothetical protein